MGGNLGNQNYSALRQINKGRIRRLGAAWVNHIEGGITTGTNQSTPVVVDGTIYIESAFGNVVAVDGKTGATQWKYTQTRGNLTRRGVAVGQGLVYTLSGDNFVVALDKDTGAVVWERQHEGFGNVEKVAVVYYDGKLLIGTNDGDRGAALAMDATQRRPALAFLGRARARRIRQRHLGRRQLAWKAARRRGFIRRSIPTWALVYFTFGNVRAGSSQDGSTRGGDNLFSNSIVALDVETGAYKWHFQSIHHDIWDMDNVMSPVLVDAKIRGHKRKLVVYGSKSGMYFILDRRDGSAPLGIDEVPVPQEPRQKTSPTQPFPRQGGWTENCVVDQPLGTAVPGNPNRAVPNYERGCLYAAHWDVPILSIPGHGGGADWNHQSFSQSTGLVYTGFGYVASAHSLTESSNGLRPPGEYQTGGIVAVDPSHQSRPLEEADALLARAWQRNPDDRVRPAVHRTTRRQFPRARCEETATSCGASRPAPRSAPARSPTKSTASNTSRCTPAAPAFLTATPRRAATSSGRSRSAAHLPPAATPPPPVVRRPVSGAPVEGSVVNNTVVLARTYNATTNTVGATESTAVNGMAPTHLRVPVGTTVTFTNPATNSNTHCATQFFEGLFNFRLAPGESATHTFAKAGEYFFNDCFSPRPTGKVEVIQ